MDWGLRVFQSKKNIATAAIFQERDFRWSFFQFDTSDKNKQFDAKEHSLQIELKPTLIQPGLLGEEREKERERKKDREKEWEWEKKKRVREWKKVN